MWFSGFFLEWGCRLGAETSSAGGKRIDSKGGASTSGGGASEEKSTAVILAIKDTADEGGNSWSTRGPHKDSLPTEGVQSEE